MPISSARHRVRFFGKNPNPDSWSKNGFCVSLLVSQNGLVLINLGSMIWRIHSEYGHLSTFQNYNTTIRVGKPSTRCLPKIAPYCISGNHFSKLFPMGEGNLLLYSPQTMHSVHHVKPLCDSTQTPAAYFLGGACYSKTCWQPCRCGGVFCSYSEFTSFCSNMAKLSRSSNETYKRDTRVVWFLVLRAFHAT